MWTINDISERHAEVTGLRFRQVADGTDIATVSRLAGDIWRHHYMPIIGAEQVEYMLDRFQNPAAIECQIVDGYEYYLLWRDDQPAGYCAWLPATAEQSLFISKLYVCNTQRRKGLGSRILDFAEGYCRERNLTRLWLTVNRHNHAAIGFYLRQGFVKAGALTQDIGGGFVMDDFKMLKNLD